LLENAWKAAGGGEKTKRSEPFKPRSREIENEIRKPSFSDRDRCPEKSEMGRKVGLSCTLGRGGKQGGVERGSFQGGGEVRPSFLVRSGLFFK